MLVLKNEYKRSNFCINQHTAVFTNQRQNRDSKWSLLYVRMILIFYTFSDLGFHPEKLFWRIRGKNLKKFGLNRILLTGIQRLAFLFKIGRLVLKLSRSCNGTPTFAHSQKKITFSKFRSVWLLVDKGTDGKFYIDNICTYLK